jgi:hypothetical protein
MAFRQPQFPHLIFLQRKEHDDNEGEEVGYINNHVDDIKVQKN